MGAIYSCLTWIQRLQIEQCLKAKVPVKDIAERIGVHTRAEFSIMHLFRSFSTD